MQCCCTYFNMSSQCECGKITALTSPSQAGPTADTFQNQKLDDLLDDVVLEALQKQRLEGVEGAMLFMTPDPSKRLILAAEADIKAGCGWG